MKFFTRQVAALVAGYACLQVSLAQSSKPASFTEPNTGIQFDAWTVAESSLSAGLTFGVALPEDALDTDATEFIGYLSCNSANGDGSGWCGISLGGSMLDSLLLVAYPQGDNVLTSFRIASDYAMPDVYTGDAKLTQISWSVDPTGFTVLFRCQGCFSWEQDGTAGNASTSASRLLLGWAQAEENPTDGACPDDMSLMQHEGQSIWNAELDANATSSMYDSWAELARIQVPGDCGVGNRTRLRH
ncbi:uncharacterized protein BJX67DRAFT_390801 [Aspergillus lucknowensis]|uniref:Cellobiose dehydrogenase-like cytochrome domain-containing protein n=1 Tax=Aspergillus lucknowensis TaxID=176173 RepID=A0ABR4LIC8_9EURO